MFASDNIKKRITRFNKRLNQEGIKYLIFIIRKNIIRFDVFFIYPIVVVFCLIIFLIRPFILIRLPICGGIIPVRLQVPKNKYLKL